MKENGINKLIELLNEYEEVKYGRYGEYEFAFDGCIRSRKDAELLNETIISKKFGFIEWLVKENKIEFREDFYLEDQHGGGFGEDEIIIMLLAIQENPISFLLSVLK